MLPEIEEAPVNPLLTRDREKQTGIATTQETVPYGASEEVVNSSRFSEQIPDITATNQTMLSEDLNYSIDHLIVAGKINTMNDPKIQVQAKHMDQTTAAMTYSQSQDATDPATNLVTPTSYIEPIPRHSNILGVPGDIDN